MPVIASPTYPLINGHAVSYASIVLALNGIQITGVRSINYRDVGEFGKFRGTGRHKIGRTAVTADHEGDIELYHADWIRLLPVLTVLAGREIGYSDGSHLVTVSYDEPTNPLDIVTDSLEGVRFFNAERSNSEGTDAAIVRVQMDIMNIRHSGKYMMTSPLRL